MRKRTLIADLLGLYLFLSAIPAMAQSLQASEQGAETYHRTLADSSKQMRPHKGAIFGSIRTGSATEPDAVTQQREQVYNRAAVECEEGNSAISRGLYTEAEVDYRTAIAYEEDWGPAYAGLAQSLTAQGRVAEALATYRVAIYDLALKYNYHAEDEAQQEEIEAAIHQNPVRYSGFGSSDDLYDWMQYAALLARTGQWAEAVTVYEGALAHTNLPGGDLPRIDVHFSQTVPQPVPLEAAAHLMSGLESNFTGWEDDHTTGLNHRAMAEYEQALSLEPQWALTNFYYGYGLQRVGLTVQARAAFGKTLTLSHDGAVQVAARKALAGMKKSA